MDLDWVAHACSAKTARRVERVQSLWSGYGEIVRAALDDERTVIVKSVSAPARPASDVSHARKQRSYEIEQRFYADYASQSGARVARRIAARPGLLVLEDLGPRRLGDERRALGWLAAFHATFLGRAPEGLWPMVTYWLSLRGAKSSRRWRTRRSRSVRSTTINSLHHAPIRPSCTAMRSARTSVSPRTTRSRPSTSSMSAAVLA